MTAVKRVVIVGASGMVGGYALRCLLEDPAVGGVTSIGRRRLGVSHAKLNEILHADFADCSALAVALEGQDTAIFCLGTYTGAVQDANSAGSRWTTRPSSRASSAPAVPTRHSRS